MNKISKQGLSVVLGILSIGNVFAENNVDVITTISVGATNIALEINEKYSSSSVTFDGDTRNLSTNPKMPGAEIGVTVLSDKFHYGFTMLITGQSVARFDNNAFDVSTNTTSSTSSQEVTSRSSYSLYLGYTLVDNFSLYGGAAFGIGSYGDEVSIDEFGPFAGARYSIRFGSTSSLNFDLSYSLVDTEVTLRDTDYTGGQHTVKSTNDGLSLSASWLKALDRGRSFFVRLKIVDLSLEGSSSIEATPAAGGGIGTATISGSQVITSLSLGTGF
ncbi:MAG: hypothetical protein ACC653_11175 [Gammaproteobacteria bacterium]